MSSKLRIDRLDLTDFTAALALSTQAGWNQLVADWRRVVDLWPELCLAGRLEGRLIATATIASYKTVGWVGMVVVDESHRGKGFGGAIMDAILQRGEEAGLQILGLDATDMGRPVYLKRGFCDSIRIDRYVRPAGGHHSIQHAARDVRADDWPAVCALDREVTGVDRSPLLRHLAGEESAQLRIIERGGQVAAFGLRRRGRTADQIGPVVASSLGLATQVLDALLSDLSSTPLLIDVPRAGLINGWLTQRGFAVARTLVRMTRPVAQEKLLCGHGIFAIAGLELG